MTYKAGVTRRDFCKNLGRLGLGGIVAIFNPLTKAFANENNLQTRFSGEDVSDLFSSYPYKYKLLKMVYNEDDIPIVDYEKNNSLSSKDIRELHNCSYQEAMTEIKTPEQVVEYLKGLKKDPPKRFDHNTQSFKTIHNRSWGNCKHNALVSSALLIDNGFSPIHLAVFNGFNNSISGHEVFLFRSNKGFSYIDKNCMNNSLSEIKTYPNIDSLVKYIYWTLGFPQGVASAVYNLDDNYSRKEWISGNNSLGRSTFPPALLVASMKKGNLNPFPESR